MAAKDAVRALRTVQLFAELSDKDLRSILRSSKEVEFDAGHTIVEQGSGGVGLHVILDGEVKVVMNGRTRARLRAGDHFGEMSLIDGEPRSASVITTTPTRTLSLAVWSFNRLLKEYPGITMKLLIALSRRLRQVDAAPTD